MDKEEGRASTSGRKERRTSERHELLESLHVKLRSIEEDTNSLKKDVTSFVEERSMLMSEIAGQLHLIRGCLVNSQGKHSSTATSSSAKTIKDKCRSIGLSGILLQDSNQSLVTRHIKVNLDTSLNLPWRS